MDRDPSSPEKILVVTKPPTDHPFAEIVEAVDRHVSQGRKCFQKFTCAKCKQRLTMEEPNILYKAGHCDNCGHVTDIEKQGCNYLMHIEGADKTEAFLKGGMK